MEMTPTSSWLRETGGTRVAGQFLACFVVTNT